MEELWKEIAGFDGKFQVSNLGRIKNNGVLATLSVGGKGYLRFGMSVNNKSKHYSVHRYVLLTFIGKPQGDRIYANHKSGVKTDNRLENLEWVTARENMLHSYKTGLHVPISINKDKFGELAPRSKRVYQYTLDGTYVNSYGSVREAGRMLNICYHGIVACANGKYKHSAGYLWSYDKLEL